MAALLGNVRGGSGGRGLTVVTGSHVAQHHDGEDREPHGQHGADRRGGLHGLDERVAGDVDHGIAEWAGELLGHRHGATQRVARGGRGFGRARRPGGARGRCRGRSAIPILPRIERPSAPPSSEAVSEMPDAAPARSGGADPTISSVVSENTGARPSEMMIEPMTTAGSPFGTVDLGEHARARAPRARVRHR